MSIKEKNYENDLMINRGAIVKVNKSSKDDVYEIKVSLCVVPKIQYEAYEYDSQVKKIRVYTEKTLRRYVVNNDMFYNNSIIDVNFSSTNLRLGYYKNVQISMFVKQKNTLRYNRLLKRLRDTIKPTIKSITDKFNEEGYICHKKKKQYNKRLNLK